MPDVLENAPTVRLEGPPREYDPHNDPVMHSVIVRGELEPGLELGLPGYKTDIHGAKVGLQGLAEYNKPKPGSHHPYREVYFTTVSGTIYRARNIQNGTWQLDSSSTDKQNLIQEACTIEIGKRFNSPHLIDDQPELSTSAVQDITLVEDSKGIPFNPDKEETDIAKRFAQALRIQNKPQP